MGIEKKLNSAVMGWGTLAIVIVIVSIVLVKFKDISGVTSDLNTTIDTFVSALSEPKNWVAITIIAAIGFGMLKLFKSKN